MGKNLYLNQIECHCFWLCCFVSITYKPLLSNKQIEYNDYLVLLHNHVLLNVNDILNCYR